jgi:hypothetical protein
VGVKREKSGSEDDGNAKFVLAVCVLCYLLLFCLFVCFCFGVGNLYSRDGFLKKKVGRP